MGKLYQSIISVPPVFDNERAEQVLGDLAKSIDEDENLTRLGSLIEGEPQLRKLLLSVCGNSPYLSGLVLREPGNLLQCLVSDPGDYLDSLSESLPTRITQAESQAAVMASLRDYKRQIALCIALADIAGLWTNDQVTQALSDAADITISCAVRFLLSRAIAAGQIVPRSKSKPEEASGYFVLGMGKLGAGELNYSSDIDLIVFFDASRTSLKEGVEPAQFFVRLTRDLVKLLQERTAEGYVWRTDLRLRPDPGATQIALSTDAGFAYYESFGQNWERAALIKARVVAGNIEAGECFLEQISPFIWRRYLDFAAVADIHTMKRRVHEFKGHAKIAVAGHDVKLGRGGIREIEFFTQTQQLIAGGRQPELRTLQTLVTLERLAQQGWIDDKTVEDLTCSYRFLRMVEHRLQMIADEQTHTLPKGDKELARVSCFCGFENVEAFSDALIKHFTQVQGYYDDLFSRLPDAGEQEQKFAFRGDDESPEHLATLEELGFSDPKAVTEIIRGWRSGRYAATRSARSRECLTEILPDLLQALSATADPSAALISFDRFVLELPAGVQLFSLLRSNTSLLRLIADIMGTAPRLARVLSRRSQILDAVIDPAFFGDLPSPDTLNELVSGQLSDAQDYQECLDRARKIGQEQAFLIGVRILSGTIGADQAGDAYAALAQSFIAALHEQVEREMVLRHGQVTNSEVVVIAMGKLGGREMTAASDLDLITVYDFDEAAGPSDGARQLSGGQYFARFTQRLISALSVQTAEGRLYEVDMRLRPSGHSGPVATHIDGFIDYQRNHAWTWEHLALTRARVVSGPERLRNKLEAAIHDVLTIPRERKKIVADVQNMRARIQKEKGSDDPWDLKLVHGGLVDIEYIAQFLQIIAAHQKPAVLSQNTLASLHNLKSAGVLNSNQAEILIPAATLYQNLTQVLRLCLENPFNPDQASPGLKNLLARASGMSDFKNLERHLLETEDAIRQVYDRLVR